jgi:hypothetical protein
VDAAGKRWATLAILAMVAGLLVYAIDRPVPQTYLLPSVLAYSDSPRNIFGAAGASLPSFLHVFAFSLLTAAVVTLRTARAAAIVAGAWCGTDLLFEFGQHPALAPVIDASLPSWFASVPMLENVGPYLLRGSFDPVDLAATLAGAALAFLTITRELAQRSVP